MFLSRRRGNVMDRRPDPGLRAIATLCVGGMVLARSIEDRVLADEIREAAMGIALSLGQWTSRTPNEWQQSA